VTLHVGRLLFGHVSEAFLHPSSPFPLPRTAFLALAAGLTALTTALLAAGPSLHTLYVLSLLAGLSFGGVCCHSPCCLPILANTGAAVVALRLWPAESIVGSPMTCHSLQVTGQCFLPLQPTCMACAPSQH
jgi:hypothetical protein